MKNQTCSVCGEIIDRPHTKHGNYIRHESFTEEEPREVYYAVHLTEKAKAHLNKLDKEFEDRDRDALAAEMVHPEASAMRKSSQGTDTITTDSGATTETEIYKDVDFSFPIDDLDHVRVASPNVVQDEDDVAMTYTNMELKEVQKAELVCREDTPSDAEIIWGVDK